MAKAEVRETCQDEPLAAPKLEGHDEGMQRALEKLRALLAQCQPGNGYLRPESQATEFASNTNEPGSDFSLDPPDQCLAREHLDFSLVMP